MEEVQEYYADGVEINLVMPWTVALTFSVKGIGPQAEPKRIAIVRMSPEHAKVVAMLLKKQIKGYEMNTGANINLPHDMYSKLGLSPTEDW